jgi:hypothetical protein
MRGEFNGEISHTEEQAVILDAVEKREIDDVIQVQAGAGTGKTALIREAAHRVAKRGESVLYVTFSKSNQEAAHAAFQGRATALAFNALAYDAMGVGRLNRRIQSVSPGLVRQAVRLPKQVVGGLSDIALARAVASAYRSFLQSDLAAPDERCLTTPVARNDVAAEAVVQLTTQLYAALRPGVDTALPLSHDTYFKAWQLAGAPGITDFSLVACDEVQDSNAVAIAVLKQAMSLLLVGDPHQAIYGFRGARNAADAFEGRRFALSQSFRFGDQVAALANRIVAQKSAPSDYQLRGLPSVETRIGAVQPGQRHTRVYRTNVALLWDAGYLAERGIPVAVLGDVSEYASALKAAFDLYEGVPHARIHHPLFAACRNWDDAKAAATDTEGGAREMAQVIQLVEDHGRSTRRLIELLRHPIHPDSARILLVTAHRAKGLEWSDTVVCDDFDATFPRSQGERRDQEINLQYVAATRCLRTLDLKSHHLQQLAGSRR